MMKKPFGAVAFAFVLATLVGGCGGAASTGGAQPGKAAGGGCDSVTIHSAEQFDECRSKCRSDKQVREQSCNNDTQCMMAAGSQTQQCFGKCEDARNTARTGGCYKE